MPQAQKIVPQQFPLASSSMRISLLTGILAGTVDAKEIKHHAVLDAEKRPHKKPVVAWGQRFDSVVLAAEWAKRKFAYTEKRTLAAWQKRIARLCDADCWEGFYWSE